MNKKFWLSLVFVVGAMLISCSDGGDGKSGGGGGDSGGGVVINATNFPDKNFREFLLGEEFGADGKITSEEIDDIELMDVEYKGISDLTGIEYFTGLVTLYCDYNLLTMLDMSKNTKLEVLSCYTNKLTTLDISKNTELIALDFGGNQINSIDVSKNPELREFWCENNYIDEDELPEKPDYAYVWETTPQNQR